MGRDGGAHGPGTRDGMGQRGTRAGDTGWDGTEGHAGQGHGTGQRSTRGRGHGTRWRSTRGREHGTRWRSTWAGDTGRDGGARGPGTRDGKEGHAGRGHGTGGRGTRAGDTGWDGGAHGAGDTGRDGGARGPGTRDTTLEHTGRGHRTRRRSRRPQAVTPPWLGAPARSLRRTRAGPAGGGRASEAERGRRCVAVGRRRPRRPRPPGAAHVRTSPRGGAGRRPLALTAASGFALGPRPGGAPGPWRPRRGPGNPTVGQPGPRRPRSLEAAHGRAPSPALRGDRPRVLISNQPLYVPPAAGARRLWPRPPRLRSCLHDPGLASQRVTFFHFGGWKRVCEHAGRHRLGPRGRAAGPPETSDHAATSTAGGHIRCRRRATTRRPPRPPATAVTPEDLAGRRTVASARPPEGPPPDAAPQHTRALLRERPLRRRPRKTQARAAALKLLPRARPETDPQPGESNEAKHVSAVRRIRWTQASNQNLLVLQAPAPCLSLCL
ncbi:uncharacterized protein AAEQ78_003615 [Lycaon pictus]